LAEKSNIDMLNIDLRESVAADFRGRSSDGYILQLASQEGM